VVELIGEFVAFLAGRLLRRGSARRRAAALSRWAARRGFTHTVVDARTLAATVGGPPFDGTRGTVDVLTGTWRDRPAMVVRLRRHTVAVVEQPGPRLAVVSTRTAVGPRTLDVPERLLDEAAAQPGQRPGSVPTGLGTPVHRPVPDSLVETHGGRTVQLVDLTTPDTVPLVGARLPLPEPRPVLSVVLPGITAHEPGLTGVDTAGPYSIAGEDAAGTRAVVDAGLDAWLRTQPVGLVAVRVAGTVRRVGHADRGLLTVVVRGWLDDEDARARAAALAVEARDLV
jgi:hypothetical protein